MTVRKLIVIRHAESLEDVDNDVYGRIPDEQIPLSPKGEMQAVSLGLQLKEEIGEGNSVHFYLSPCKRVMDTADLLISHMRGIRCSRSDEPLIRKQDWGCITLENRDQIERERYEAGVLRYTFRGGESGPEFVARFTLFAKQVKDELNRSSYPEHVAVITHGFGVRTLLMVLLGWSEEYFESLAHPDNCGYKRLEIRQDGSLVLLDPMSQHNLMAQHGFVGRKTS